MWGYVSVYAPDLYGGSEKATKAIYRDSKTTTWKDLATTGTTTFTANPGDVYEVAFGLSTTDDDDEVYGQKITYTVPCESYPAISKDVVDYTAEGSVTSRMWDPEDGTVIAAATPVDIDNGDVFNIKTELQALYEQDFGNRYCDKGNVLVIKYYTGNFTSIKLTSVEGIEYPTTSVPSIDTNAASGYTLKAFEIPTLKSNGILNFYTVVDASGSGKEPEGTYNVTWSLYDVSRFINNDKNPPTVDCGVEDEDGADVGNAGAVTGTLYITSAS